ncbi:hypothetical protein F4808DRAFT_237079 [Astrocystis sublimbata]|nr:hypothetical protein F4808DRAFT_237079 [Astrocystis sublimbata]
MKAGPGWGAAATHRARKRKSFEFPAASLVYGMYAGILPVTLAQVHDPLSPFLLLLLRSLRLSACRACLSSILPSLPTPSMFVSYIPTVLHNGACILMPTLLSFSIPVVASSCLAGGIIRLHSFYFGPFYHH